MLGPEMLAHLGLQDLVDRLFHEEMHAVGGRRKQLLELAGVEGNLCLGHRGALGLVASLVRSQPSGSRWPFLFRLAGRFYTRLWTQLSDLERFIHNVNRFDIEYMTTRT